MEVYQAAENYKEYSDYLISTDSYIDDVWVCYDMGDYYFLALHPKIKFRLSLQGEKVVITKQRGGTRQFKNFRAVTSALKQIGQTSVNVSIY